MPIHDWNRIPSGIFHHFHQDWSIEIARTLNRGNLPKGLSALVEQRAGTVESWGKKDLNGGLVTRERPNTSIVRKTAKQIYADRANRVTVRHHLGRILAVIEILSPGNKDSRASLRDFVEKTIDFMRQGVHLLLIDLFPPSPRDPFGIHKMIWDEIHEEEFQFPPGKDRILASYRMGDERIAYVEPVGVGDSLPSMPSIFFGCERPRPAGIDVHERVGGESGRTSNRGRDGCLAGPRRGRMNALRQVSQHAVAAEVGVAIGSPRDTKRLLPLLRKT
jgi:hypothetical protein